MLSVITVATEIDDGIATVSPAARTAHHCDTSLRARRYTGIGGERPEERVHDLEPRIRGLEVRRDPEDEREHGGVQRPEAVLVATQAETVALDERRRTDQVAHLVGMDARHAHERRAGARRPRTRRGRSPASAQGRPAVPRLGIQRGRMMRIAPETPSGLRLCAGARR